MNLAGTSSNITHSAGRARRHVATLAKGRAEALFIIERPVLIPLRSHIIDLALKHRLLRTLHCDQSTSST